MRGPPLDPCGPALPARPRRDPRAARAGDRERAGPRARHPRVDEREAGNFAYAQGRARTGRRTPPRPRPAASTRSARSTAGTARAARRSRSSTATATRHASSATSGGRRRRRRGASLGRLRQRLRVGRRLVLLGGTGPRRARLPRHDLRPPGRGRLRRQAAPKYCEPGGEWTLPQEMGIREQGACAGQDPEDAQFREAEGLGFVAPARSATRTRAGRPPSTARSRRASCSARSTRPPSSSRTRTRGGRTSTRRASAWPGTRPGRGRRSWSPPGIRSGASGPPSRWTPSMATTSASPAGRPRCSSRASRRTSRGRGPSRLGAAGPGPAPRDARGLRRSARPRHRHRLLRAARLDPQRVHGRLHAGLAEGPARRGPPHARLVRPAPARRPAG